MKKALLLIISSMLFIWTLSATATNFVGEVFAASGCSYCPSAQLGLEQLYNGHPNVIPILWYGGSSPAYSSRGSFYGVGGIPDARFNGNVNVVGGGGSSMYNSYLPKYNQIIARNSPLEMSNTLNLANNQLIVNTNVTLTGNVTQTNNKLVTILTRHNETGSNKFLGIAYHDQPFDLTTQGQTQEYSASFTLNQSWILQEIKAVSFVQSWSGDKIILQGTQTGFSGLMTFFTADVTSGTRDLTVNFNDLSFPQGGVLEWQWDFDNDGVIDSYEQSPSYTYTEPGTYSVTLTVSDGTDTDTSTITNMITVYDADSAQGLAQGTWHPGNGIYHVIGDITIPNGAILEILPGTEIVFDDNTKMFVNGTIQANGTEGNPIKFYSDSQWKGISFEYSDNDNQFTYCEFKNANASALKIVNSNAKINSCIFTNNTGAATAGAIDVSGTSNVEIKNSFFANNKSSNNAGAIGIASSTVDLKNNIIANNTGQNAGALIVKNSATLNAINNT
ncbi:MAG TPA: PKD domain-containing protein, partial [Candidatus Cloacimonadota bacterium]|nr:PKD domain-containing protein [Candidatus Cloacimonadota bacterium]